MRAQILNSLYSFRIKIVTTALLGAFIIVLTDMHIEWINLGAFTALTGAFLALAATILQIIHSFLERQNSSNNNARSKKLAIRERMIVKERFELSFSRMEYNLKNLEETSGQKTIEILGPTLQKEENNRRLADLVDKLNKMPIEVILPTEVLAHEEKERKTREQEEAIVINFLTALMERLTERGRIVLKLRLREPTLTAAEIAQIMGVGNRTVAYHLLNIHTAAKELQEELRRTKVDLASEVEQAPQNETIHATIVANLVNKLGI